MNEDIRIFLENDGKSYDVPMGATLLEIAKDICPKLDAEKTGEEIPVLAALVDRQLVDLNYCVMNSHLVKFIGYDHPEARRCYIRSLLFVLQVAVRKLYPQKQLSIDYSLPTGTYCEIHELEDQPDGRPKIYYVTDEEIDAIKKEMKSIVDADLPFLCCRRRVEDAVELFRKNHQPKKATLLESLGNFFCNVYYLDGVADTFHGALLYSTGYIYSYDLIGFNSGFCIQFPVEGSINQLPTMKRQSKLAATLNEYSDWCSKLGAKGIGALNQAIRDGLAVPIINLSEALHERKYAEIANKIYERRGSVKIVFIAGPSSSGKTSSSLRLALQCKVLGLNPQVIELDNYFVARDRTPKDENGEYDFESLQAMDIELLNKHLNALLAGERVELPRYDFKSGQPCFEGNFMKLDDKDILIMEGIHALNPAMVPGVDSSHIFRVYASALTSLNIDENNNISTSDNRLIRRIVRDNLFRGYSPENTLLRWHSVRRGENKNIFTFQENADAYFNSAHIFEFSVLKYYAEPLLRRIPANSPAYPEASRLLKFFDYVVAFSPEEIAAIPPTSILREFIGGQTLTW